MTMKIRFAGCLLMSGLCFAPIALAAATSADQAGKSPVFASPEARMSYALGATLGGNLKKQHIQLDNSSFVQGFQDAVSDKGRVLLSDEELKKEMSNFQQVVMNQEKENFKVAGNKNETAAKNFLQKNKSEKGVITLPDGLQYQVIEAGQGSKPKKSDVVTVDYEGKTLDGVVFDSSYQRGKPADFRVSDVIQGWQEALQLMQTGATWMIYIPANLAYGEQGVPGHIGPNELLVFKVHLIAIQAPAADVPTGK